MVGRTALIASVSFFAGAAIGAPLVGELGRVTASTSSPQPYVNLSAEQQQAFDSGRAIFNTAWVRAGTPGAARIDGLGPLYNAASCDACHNEGARGRGPEQDGLLPTALVISLSTPAVSDGTGDIPGDPVYGHTFNTAALEGFMSEGSARVHYEDRTGRYADGTPWQLRLPHYTLVDLHYGALAVGTVIKPRLAPALYGDGLLERVPLAWLVAKERRNGSAIDGVRGRVSWRVFDGQRLPGRFAWQGNAATIHDQTTKALAREMGITNHMVPDDDCTPAEQACREAPNGGTPEMSMQFHVIMDFQRWLGVPVVPTDGVNERRGAELFESTGCAACHTPELPVVLENAQIGGDPCLHRSAVARSGGVARRSRCVWPNHRQFLANTAAVGSWSAPAKRTISCTDA